MKRYYTLSELAQASGLPQSTLRTWAASGRLPATKRGGNKTWYIDAERLLGSEEQKELAHDLFRQTRQSVV